MSTVTHNDSTHQGSAVSCHGCEHNANDAPTRELAGGRLHCTTCHEDGHRACTVCGACLPDGHRWDRHHCSSTCRVRAKAEREREAAERATWEAEHPEEAAKKREELESLAASIGSLAASVGGLTPEQLEHRKRNAELKATADRCVKCDRPFAAGETIYRRAELSAINEGPVLPYCAADRCGQSDGRHNADAPEGRYYPACRCPGEDGDRKWLKPEPCAYCDRPVANDRETANPWRFTRDWQGWDEERPPTPRTFCSENCRRAFQRAKARAKRGTPERDCEGCGERFTPTRSDARYCSPACKQRAYRGRAAR